MSEEDRRKWNKRYAAGAYATRPAPSAWVQQWLPDAPVGRALDVACGLGRNARFLAQADFAVDAVDISSEALSRAAALARSEGVEVSWRECDLEQGLPEDCVGYQLIIMIRYVNAALLEDLCARLAPGGYLLVEEHLRTAEQVAGPDNPLFRVAPGELRQALVGLQVLGAEESVLTDPDGARVALARVAARRPVQAGSTD